MSLLDRKVEYWEHQLLDLGKRNRMINYRETKRTTLKFVEPSLCDIFEKLVLNEEELTFQRLIDKETDIRVFSILSLLDNLSSSITVTLGDIKTEESILERQKALKNLRTKSRLALEEQGTNILYLSFGFIEWKDGKGASAQWIKSPLILVPVTLVLESLNSPYKIKRYEDDIVVNPTLEYYLKTEYGIILPQFNIDTETASDYLQNLEEIADQRGWRILNEVSLGLLSFLKITMYNDLIRNEERIRENPVIRAMAGDYEEANTIPEELQHFNLDVVSTQDCYQVLSADSSQQEAILYSKNNVSFVMQGPPGTGKSQTITNIIAEALADGKKVLFVSEKMAALQVVYHRLQEAHLGEFCLPLHSYKANKKEILEQIGANLRLNQTCVKDEAINALEELQSIRQELNQYVEELHTFLPELNISCYGVYSKLEEFNDVSSISFAFCDPLKVSQTKLQAYLGALKEYTLSLERLNCFIKNNPWQGLSSRTVGYDYAEQMKMELISFNDLIKELKNVFNGIVELPGLNESTEYDSVLEISELFNEICELPQIPEVWLEEYDFEHSIKFANEAQNAFTKLFELRKIIAKVFADTIYKFDYNNWNAKILSEANDIVELSFIKGKNSDFFVSEAESLQGHFEVLKDSLTKASDIYTAINDKLGINFSINARNQQTLISLSELIGCNVILNKGWFSSDITKVKNLVAEAKKFTNDIKSIKEKILDEWEPEIFDLDYAPILLRYKTDYTSFIKIFKKQYRQDKKRIQGSSKTVLKKFSDDMAVNILSSLKTYYDRINWLNDNKSELENVLNNYYKGINSDWDSVINAIDICDKIKNLPIGELSFKLLDILSSDHKEEATFLKEMLPELNSVISISKDEVKAIDADISVDSTDFDVDETIKIINIYIERLTGIISKMKEIKQYLVDENEQINSIYCTIEKLNTYKEAHKAVLDNFKLYNENYKWLFVGEKTNWSSIISLMNRVSELKKSKYFRSFSVFINISVDRKKKILELTDQIRTIQNNGANSFDWLKRQFSVETALQSLSIDALYEKMYGCLENISDLENWIDYQEAKDKCFEIGLKDFIEKFESTDLKEYKKVETMFLKGFYNMWLNSANNILDSVRRFRKNTQNERINRFKELDDLQLAISQMRIREKLINNLPTTHSMLKATDEVAILNKELNKKRNIMPLRKLFRQIPNLLMKLKPCLMMSPLSVSYFLETEAYNFDLVIFDESSQIFPEDAIGAIFRGAQVIIAGDSKQLPPTNFFASSTNNSDGDYDVQNDEDIEEIVSDSILEESAAVLPNRTLLWHYRSKHESLIAFSNQEIYKNNLITFPNSISATTDMGVEYIYVEDGRYDRGGKKNNIREAEECVKLVFEHIVKHPERSLGIIAFSESQQTAIENAIIECREDHPSYEWFFDESRDEPFFIKNLENVQGDERDTIIFSICYGKDKNDVMHMNFGPIGHSGGERRLNVAVTRAKCNIKLVGSIMPSDIDTNRAKSEGARMLRSYIEYAIKGTSALNNSKIRIENIDSADNFCEIVIDFLEENGYSVKRQIGCSDYRIDIAVENPYCKGEYIVGVECDGLSYHYAKTARDRDHLRGTILERMGWHLYRVWSTEWIRNTEIEKKSLLDYIQLVYERKNNNNSVISENVNKKATVSIENIATETEKSSEMINSDNPYNFVYYKEAEWWEAEHSDSSDNITRISENILHIVRIEEPIHIELLYKRMGPSFTAGKATGAVKNTIDRAIKQKLADRIIIDEDKFVRLLPLNSIKVRVPHDWDTPRPIEYIHTEEVSAAMLKIISESYGITEEALSSECARIFGFERKGAKIKAKTNAAIKFLMNNGKIRIIEGKVQLL